MSELKNMPYAMPWERTPPDNDGEFFYTGKLPNGMEYVGIVYIVTDLGDSEKRRIACVFIPPFWGGDKDRLLPTVVHAPLRDWTGEWAGPRYGLSCVEC